MTKKFTEEQFKKLVKIQEKYFPLTMMEHGVGGESPYEAISETCIKLSDFIWDEKLGNEAVALMNPVTRELAHELYVEKEKKYVWSSKKVDRDSNVLILYIDKYGMVSTSYRKVYEKNFRNEDMFITESEIKAWGYNPEMFDKEEV